jgi:hypothetical protein
MSEKKTSSIHADEADERYGVLEYCDDHLVFVFLFLIVLLGILSYIVSLANP